MAQIAAEFPHAAAATRSPANVFKAWWDALVERRERQLVRAALYGLSDRELADFGIASGEIEYAAAHRNSDPRGSR
jgi:uncharacterized protein YjiS (DUF1127 family)